MEGPKEGRKWAAQDQTMGSATERKGRKFHLPRATRGLPTASYCPSWFVLANTSKACRGSFGRTAAILYRVCFLSGLFIPRRIPVSPRRSHSGIAAAWFGALKSRKLAKSSKSLSWMAMPFPSPSRSQPSPSGQTVKIVSGSEPPSSTSSLFFKPKHQCCVHIRMSHGFFYSFYFQRSFYFQGVKGLFRVHKSLCIQWHFSLSSLPWDFFITCRWSRVEKRLLNPADSRGWLESGSSSSLPSSALVKILHNHWKQFKRSCLWSIKQDSFSKGDERTHEIETARFCLSCARNEKASHVCWSLHKPFVLKHLPGHIWIHPNSDKKFKFING